MARRVLTNAYISIDGDDISDDCREVAFEVTKGLEDSTTFGDSWMERLSSLKDFTLTITAMADEATGKASEVLWTAWDKSTSVAFEVRADQGAVSSTNPKWTGNLHVQTINPVAGSVGDVQLIAASCIGDGAAAKAVT